MNVTANAAVGRIPPPPNAMPGWAKKPAPPPKKDGAAGAKVARAVTAAVPPTR